VTIRKGEGQIKNKKTDKNTKEIAPVVIAARAAEKKGADYIKILDIKERMSITDYFLIISTKNSRLSKSVEKEIKDKLALLEIKPLNVSGQADGNWILLDYNDFVIHIFTDEYRQYYDLERLWKDSRIIEWD
jgi:ribosome-associated protein